MIKKLQKRFIRISTVSLSVAIVAVVAIVNVFNWISVKTELETTLDFICRIEPGMIEREDAGEYVPMDEPPMGFSDFEPPEGDGTDGNTEADKPFIAGFTGGSIKPGLHRARFSSDFGQDADKHQKNMLAQSNWYAVFFDENGAITEVSGDNYASDENETIAAFALSLALSGKTQGLKDDYMFRFVCTDAGRTLFLLNCETKLANVRQLVLISGLSCLGAILVTFIIVSAASRRAVRPTIKNMEQQKQFITNASHELKTPLTVISTNMELLDMEVPGNQWVNATKKQTNVMRHLVDELVYLSRMEEESAQLNPENVNLKALIEEVAEPFEAMAEYAGRDFKLSLEEGLHAFCDRAGVQRMLSTLCDNAMKYAYGEGAVEIKGKTEGRHAVIEISNPVETPLSEEQCQRLFDRFYRADPSRSKEKQSGFGIGLAIARAVAEKHGGAIIAEMDGEKRLKFICRLPVKGA